MIPPTLPRFTAPLPSRMMHRDPGTFQIARGVVLVLATHHETRHEWRDEPDGTRHLVPRYVDTFEPFDVSGSYELPTRQRGRAETVGRWSARPDADRLARIEHHAGRRWTVLETVGMPRDSFRMVCP